MDRGVLATWLLLAILAFGQGSADANKGCMPGISTPGITTPIGDIILEEGNPLEINCTLSPDHEKAQGRNASDLTFYQGGREVPPEHITTINETTIQLRVDHLPVAKYMYYCQLRQPLTKQLIPVCLNEVMVGSKPEEVQNFTCTSQNWESLTCKWSIKENPLKTTYKIFFNLPGRAGRRFNATCPLDTDVKNNNCTWALSTVPIYRQPYEYYYFALTGMNDLGTVSFPPIKFHHYAHVIPAKPVNLQAHNITTNSIDLTWGIPFPLQNFPPGLLHRVEFQSQWDHKNHWEIANTSSLNKNLKNLTYHLTGLKFAFTNYTIHVMMKSTAAVGDGKWSPPANVTLRTAATIPGATPKTDIGSFEILRGITQRDVYIYWQRIPKYLQNGDRFEYKIIQEEETGETKILTPNETTDSYAKIKGLSYNSYKFIIYSSNSIGLSKHPSIITIPSHTASLPEPLSFTKIAFGNGVYELSWRKPPDFKNIKNYTIFWCDNERDRPYQCTGFLNWTHVPHDVYIKNITVPEDKIYQFAISANTANSSSGLLWATCTVIHNKGIGKMKNVWINRVGSTFIEVGWKLECSDRIGLVMGYRIYYCPIVSPINRTCRDPLKYTNVSGDSLNIRGNITELMPYTTYMVSISVISRGGREGLQSDPQLSTTLEAAPDPPYNVQVTDVTNTSLIVNWSPPALMNGVLQYYEVHLNNNSTRVEATNGAQSTRVKLSNLPSYTNHTIYVTACTGSCSERSESITVQTTVGNPGKVERLLVRRMNVSQFLVTWQPASIRSGEIGYYELSVEQVDGANRSLKHMFNTTGTEYIVPVMDCNSNDNRRVYVFAVRAINFDQHNGTFFGNWSDPQEHDNCFDSGVSPQTFIIWSVCVFSAIVLGLSIWLYGKKCWQRCKEMREIDIELPPGLDPLRDNKEHISMSNGVGMQSDSNSKGQADLEDSKLLLAKSERHGRNPSGDSSGCSSGHESVSSSLTSQTQFSTDSGAEVDQLNGLSEFVDRSHLARDGDARWDAYPNLTRYNGSAQSTPNLSGDGEARSETPRYTCLGSCPSTGHLPSSRTSDHSPLASSSSSLYCKSVNKDTTPKHSSYCRIGNPAVATPAAAEDNSSSSLRSQVPNTTPSKGYITIASVTDGVVRAAAPTPSVPSVSPYIAHPPTWTPNMELVVSPPLAALPTPANSQIPRNPPCVRIDDICKERPIQLESIPEHSDPYSLVGVPASQTAVNSNSVNSSNNSNTNTLSDSKLPGANTSVYVKVGSPKKAAASPSSSFTNTTASGYVALPTTWPSNAASDRDIAGMPRPVQPPPSSPSPTSSPVSTISSASSSTSSSPYVPHKLKENSDASTRLNVIATPEAYSRLCSSVLPSSDSDSGGKSNSNSTTPTSPT